MKYPKGIKNSFSKNISFANRGMSLECDINLSNDYYLKNNIAVVYKKPTPITVNEVDFKSRCDAVITKAHFILPSTTDYNGIYKAKYIDFEAKETSSLTSFALSNIHSHQLKHLDMIHKHGGIGFIIIRFTRLNETYLITIEKFNNYFLNNDKKSIPYKYIKENGCLIKDKYNPRVDYIEIVDTILKENKHEENI